MLFYFEPKTEIIWSAHQSIKILQQFWVNRKVRFRTRYVWEIFSMYEPTKKGRQQQQQQQQPQLSETFLPSLNFAGDTFEDSIKKIQRI